MTTYTCAECEPGLIQTYNNDPWSQQSWPTVDEFVRECLKCLYEMGRVSDDPAHYRLAISVPEGL